MNIRADAANIIDKVISQKKSLDEALVFHLAKYSSPLDRALLQELSYGAIRWYQRLDANAKLLLHQSP